MSDTFIAGLAAIARQREQRLQAKEHARIERGPCGGWHYRGRFCKTCIELGHLPSHTVRGPSKESA